MFTNTGPVTQTRTFDDIVGELTAKDLEASIDRLNTAITSFGYRYLMLLASEVITIAILYTTLVR